MSVRYNPQDQDMAYKSFRLTVSNPILVEAIEELQRKTGNTEKEIAKEALLQFLEEKEQIKLT